MENWILLPLYAITGLCMIIAVNLNGYETDWFTDILCVLLWPVFCIVFLAYLIGTLADKVAERFHL
jgi:cbb3-type cytochrome oxidase subunit 1